MEVRRGITRTVLLVSRWAVKVPSLRTHGDGLAGLLWSWTRGVQANLSEREWSGSPGTCPVLWSLSGLVNVYPRCKLIADDADFVDYDAIGFLGPGDRKPPNVGLLDGQFVFLDYDMSFNDVPPCTHVRPIPRDDEATA